jgi:alanine racemase
MSQFIIDTQKIRHNITSIRKHIGKQTKFMYVIKANGYGFGSKSLLAYLPLDQIDYFGVSRINEALEVAETCNKPILLLKNTFTEEISQGIHFNNIEYTISDTSTVDAISSYLKKANRQIKIHLKVNTGMNRLGIPLSELDAVINDVLKRPEFELKGIYTHFANADDKSSDFTTMQNNLFNTVIAKHKSRLPAVLFHAANSAATAAFPETHHDMVRCGLICYGIMPPLLEALDIDLSLKEAIEIRTKVIQVLAIEANQGVGYGQSYIAKEATRVASIAIGYADGINRSLSNKGVVWINGHLCPIIGNISMDQMSIKLDHVPAKIEDDVYLVSPEKNALLTTNQLAKLCKTLPYELLISIGGRVDRVYI